MKRELLSGIVAVLAVVAVAESVRMPQAGATPLENAKAVQTAVDACAAAGGGRVSVPAGVWTCGTIRLRSNVELYLQKGAVLLASPNLDDYNAADEYPENWPCPSEGWSARHFIIAHRVTHAAITGEGVIDGNADEFFVGPPRFNSWTKIAWSLGVRNFRENSVERHRPGQLIVFVKSKDLRVTGITVRNATCWSLFFHGCDGVKVSDYTVRNGFCDLNTDGIDIDCCSDVLIERADIRTGDDSIAIRASQKHLGVEKPCENIRIRDCDLTAYAMGIRIGVGNGLIRKVDISNVRVHHAAWGVSFDCWYGKRAQAGVDVEDVTVSDSRFDGCYENWRFRIGGDRQLFGVRRVKFRNCVFTSPMPGSVSYSGDKSLADFSLDACTWSPAADNPFNAMVRGKDHVVQ